MTGDYRTSLQNLLLIALFITVTLFTAFHEEYLRMISKPFWVAIVGGFAICTWLAFGISTKRLLALMLCIFVIEYIKETIGIRTHLWTYHSSKGLYNFGVWAWVMAGLIAYTLATRIVIRFVARVKYSAPGWLNPAILALIFLIIPLCLGPYRGGTNALFWLFYIIVFVAGLYASAKMDFSVFAGLVITSWIVANPSEYLGSINSGVWTFNYDTNYPPLFLLFGCWPLEILVQYSLSALVAKERLNLCAAEKEAPKEETRATKQEAPRAPRVHIARKREEVMVRLTQEERQLRFFMRICCVFYFLVGFAFILMPHQILGLSNRISKMLPFHFFKDIPVSVEYFWLCLAFSMMMTITALCVIIQGNVRKNKGYTIPLLVSKAASSLSSLTLFIVSAKYLAYLAIFLVDGAIFWATLFFFLRAEKAFFAEQTAFLRKEPAPAPTTGPTTVVSLKGDDKFKLLDEVLEKSGFFDILEKSFQKSGRPREAFSVVVKPNFMFMHAKKDISTYTDPQLVEHLIDRIAARGFFNIALVEAQSTYGNYYRNREVVNVAKYVGYTGKNYRIVDLTEEMVPFDYGGGLGKHFVGPTWKDADFRISFAKNKTHTFSNYTLTLKNVYGTLPLQNKIKEYHSKREYDWPTIETMRHFHVDFGLIDAIYSADGQFGVITCPEPKHTKTILGGENLIAVDWVGAKKMGLDPDNPRIGRFLSLAVEAFGKPDINVIGDDSVYEPWENVNPLLIDSLDVIEEAYVFADWWFSVLTAMDGHFPLKKRAWPVLVMRKLIGPIKRIFFRYDNLRV